MFTISIRNSRNERTITVRTLNRKKVEAVMNGLYPPSKRLTDESEIRAKAQFDELLNAGEEDAV